MKLLVVERKVIIKYVMQCSRESVEGKDGIEIDSDIMP